MSLPKRYVLVIAEKPRAAAKIAEALGAGSKLTIGGIPVWIGRFRGRDFVIAPTAGHLFTLHTDEKGFPVFNYSWGPRWVYEPGSKHLAKFYDALRRLSPNAEHYINACDYDIEGSVIGYNIIRHLGDVTRASRVKFSALTKEDIRKAFEDPQPLDWGNIESGLARHVLDWIWGINVSRALTRIYQKLSGERATLSAGRVQSPTLIELVERYVEREAFVPTPLFTVSVKVLCGGKEFTLTNGFDPFRRQEDARRLAKVLRSKKLVVKSAEKRVVSLAPPPPFNLTELQLEAARVFGYSPARTLEIAEELYLRSLISYPRTNSEKIPPTVDNSQILQRLTGLPEVGAYASELLRRGLLVPREGPGEDPAHPAIHPTGYLPTRELGREESNVYELVVRRYLASFYPSSTVEELVYTIVEPETGTEFRLAGRRVVSQEWLRVYHYRKVTALELPALRTGEEVPVTSVEVVKLYTRPPPLYTKATILRWMESVNIGTEATRAEIIEKLFERGYVRGSSINATELGLEVAQILGTLFKEITEVELTRELERKLREIAFGKVRRESVIEEAVSKLRPKLEEVKRVLSDSEAEELKRRLGLSAGLRCRVCGRDSVGEEDGVPLCQLHLRAYRNLKEAYAAWREGTGVGFEEYLETLSRLPKLGRLVKEVVAYLRNSVR